MIPAGAHERAFRSACTWFDRALFSWLRDHCPPGCATRKRGTAVSTLTGGGQMTDYAVINPATGEQVKTYPDDHGRRARSGDRAGRTRPIAVGRGRRRSTSAPRWSRRVGELHASGARSWPRSPSARWASRIEQALGEVDFCVDIYGYYADNGPELHEGRADRAAGRRGLGDHPPQLAGRAPRDHAVELPQLPGGALRRPEPDDRQHDAAQARAAVPRDRRGAAADLPRRRVPRGRLRQHLRDQRADRRRSSPIRACRASR